MLRLAVVHLQRTGHMGVGMSKSLWTSEYRTRQKSDKIKVAIQFWCRKRLQGNLMSIDVLHNSEKQIPEEVGDI